MLEKVTTCRSHARVCAAVVVRSWEAGLVYGSCRGVQIAANEIFLAPQSASLGFPSEAKTLHKLASMPMITIAQQHAITNSPPLQGQPTKASRGGLYMG